MCGTVELFFSVQYRVVPLVIKEKNVLCFAVPHFDDLKGLREAGLLSTAFVDIAVVATHNACHLVEGSVRY